MCFQSPRILLLALVAALLSNVIPYGIDQFVMKEISRSNLRSQALLPVTATVVGFLESVALVRMPRDRAVILAIAISGGNRGFQSSTSEKGVTEQTYEPMEHEETLAWMLEPTVGN